MLLKKSFKNGACVDTSKLAETTFFFFVFELKAKVVKLDINPILRLFFQELWSLCQS